MTPRREFLKASLSVVAASSAFPADRSVFAYVGCYTTEQRHGRGDGLHAFRFALDTAEWTPIQRVDQLVNPSFLIAAPDGRHLYSAHGDQSYATAYAVDRASGRLTVLGQGKTGGANGVHLALSHDGRFLALANYASGSVAVLPVQPDGGLADFVHLAELRGPHGPNPAEQTGSHPHQVVFDPSGQFLLVPDKGLDRVFVFRFDAKTGMLTELPPAVTRAGAGPRHLAFHPKLPVLWVLNELNSTVCAYRWNAVSGSLDNIQELPSLPPDFRGENTAAEICVSPDGAFVYCSNRGHDSIARYRADAASGRLTALGWTPSEGKSPRYIGFDPAHQYLFATNEQGDTVTAFRHNRDNGSLSRAGRPLPSPSAVTIAFVPPK